MKLKSMNHVLEAISRCDVILKNGQEQFVGLYYDQVNLDWPIVLFKCDWGFNYYLSKALELMPVPCVEHKLLASAIFENTKEGDYVDRNYMQAVAKVYSNLKKFKDNKEDFDEKLNDDVRCQLYQLEANICKKAEKKYLIKKALETKIQTSEDEALDYIQNTISKIAEEIGFDYKVFHNASKGTYQFYLENVLEEYGFDLWVMVMVSMQDQKIFVGNRCIFKNFELCEAADAVDYIKMLVKTINEKLRNDVKTFCEEFEINPRLLDIANNSIKTMLEVNYNYTGIEYGFDDSMKTQVMVYLRDVNDKAKMFVVCITYNEFLRNPDAFKKFIEEPKVHKKWNFWSRRRKYNQEVFDKRFQTITS